jgi:hypothetical protein
VHHGGEHGGAGIVALFVHAAGRHDLASPVCLAESVIQSGNDRALVVMLGCFGDIFGGLHSIFLHLLGLNLLSDNTLPPAIKALLPLITIG